MAIFNYREKDIQIYTDRFIDQIPYIKNIWKILNHAKFTTIVDIPDSISGIFSTMNNIVDMVSKSTGKEYGELYRSLIFNKTLCIKGVVESVLFFCNTFHIEVSVEHIVDVNKYNYTIQIEKLPGIDFTEFSILFQDLCNELLFFAGSSFMFEEITLEFSYDILKTSFVSANFTVNILCPYRYEDDSRAIRI